MFTLQPSISYEKVDVTGLAFTYLRLNFAEVTELYLATVIWPKFMIEEDLTKEEAREILRTTITGIDTTNKGISDEELNILPKYLCKAEDRHNVREFRQDFDAMAKARQNARCS